MEKMKEAEEKREVVHLGLIYDVERQKFDIVYKDLLTNEIRIGHLYGEGDQEANTSISAA